MICEFTRYFTKRIVSSSILLQIFGKQWIVFVIFLSTCHWQFISFFASDNFKIRSSYSAFKFITLLHQFLLYSCLFIASQNNKLGISGGMPLFRVIFIWNRLKFLILYNFYLRVNVINSKEFVSHFWWWLDISVVCDFCASNGCEKQCEKISNKRVYKMVSSYCFCFFIF